MKRHIFLGRFILTWLVAANLACEKGIVASPDLVGDQDATVGMAFQQGDLVLGPRVYTRCDGWTNELLPPGDPVLLDLFFPGGEPKTMFSQVKPEDVQAVVAAGGESVREFNVGVFRARVPRASLSQVSAYGPLSHARSVPDPGRFDVSVLIGYRSKDASLVKGRFEELGGVIRSHWDHIDAFSGVIPDEGIPAFRNLGGALRYISLYKIRCLY